MNILWVRAKIPSLEPARQIRINFILFIICKCELVKFFLAEPVAFGVGEFDKGRQGTMENGGVFGEPFALFVWFSLHIVT